MAEWRGQPIDVIETTEGPAGPLVDPDGNPIPLTVPLRFTDPDGTEWRAFGWTPAGDVRSAGVAVASATFTAARDAAQAESDAAVATSTAAREAAVDVERVEWAKAVGLLDAQGRPVGAGAP